MSKPDEQIINPKLGFGSKIILGIAILIFLVGIQGGLIGGIVFGGISFGFYKVAIKQLAKYKKVELMIKAPLLTKEELEKNEHSTKLFKKIVFILICVGMAITFLSAFLG